MAFVFFYEAAFGGWSCVVDRTVCGVVKFTRVFVNSALQNPSVSIQRFAGWADVSVFLRSPSNFHIERHPFSLTELALLDYSLVHHRISNFDETSYVCAIYVVDISVVFAVLDACLVY